MPTVNHFPNLVRAFREYWDNRIPLLRNFTLRNDGNRYWWVEDRDYQKVASWECRPFPGCSALITTTQFQVYDDYREQGIGKELRSLQHKAYHKAGFSGEISTVRTDNAIMNGFMTGRVIEEFPSDFGGTFKLWLTRFNPVPTVPVRPVPVQVQTPPPPPRTPFTYAETPPNPPMRVTFQEQPLVPAPADYVEVKKDWLKQVREQYK